MRLSSLPTYYLLPSRIGSDGEKDDGRDEDNL